MTDVDLTRPVELAARAVYERAISNPKALIPGKPFTPWEEVGAAGRHRIGESVLPAVAAAEPALTAQAFRRAAEEIEKLEAEGMLWASPSFLRELADKADPPRI